MAKTARCLFFLLFIPLTRVNEGLFTDQAPSPREPSHSQATRDVREPLDIHMLLLLTADTWTSSSTSHFGAGIPNHNRERRLDTLDQKESSLDARSHLTITNAKEAKSRGTTPGRRVPNGGSSPSSALRVLVDDYIQRFYFSLGGIGVDPAKLSSPRPSGSS